jgi:hypothetical protein
MASARQSSLADVKFRAPAELSLQTPSKCQEVDWQPVVISKTLVDRP